MADQSWDQDLADSAVCIFDFDARALIGFRLRQGGDEGTKSSIGDRDVDVFVGQIGEFVDQRGYRLSRNSCRKWSDAST